MKVLHRSRSFTSVRAGRFYLVVKDTRIHRPLFSERNGFGCHRFAISHWLVVLFHNRKETL